MDGNVTTFFRKRRIAVPGAPIKSTKFSSARALDFSGAPARTERIEIVNETVESQLSTPIKRPRITDAVPSTANVIKQNQYEDEARARAQQEIQAELEDLAREQLLSQYDCNSLELPAHYRQLEDIFRAADTCVALMLNRKESCTFIKLRQRVECMTKKAFNLQKLAQIMNILPRAYHLRYDYSLPGPTTFQAFSQSPNRYTEKLIINLRVDDVQVRPKHLKERLELFHKNLYAHLLCHYEKFLQDRRIPKPKGIIKKWHPFFVLGNVPSVEAKSVEVEPDKGMLSPVSKAAQKSVQRVLARARRRLVWDDVRSSSTSSFETNNNEMCIDKGKIIDIDDYDKNNNSMGSCNTPIKAFPHIADSPIKTPMKSPFKTPTKSSQIASCKKNLFDTPTKTPTRSIHDPVNYSPIKPVYPDTPPSTSSTPTTKSDADNTIKSGLLKGVSMSLLEKIKIRELQSSMSTPEHQKRADLLSRLPEIVRAINVYFTSESKECMPYDKVINRIVNASTTRATASTIHECLDMLSEIAPNWISTIKISRGRYMKITKAFTATGVIRQIEEYKRANHLE